MFLYACIPEETSHNRVKWLWTKAAMKLDCGTSTLDSATFEIVGISNSFNTKSFIYVATNKKANGHSRKLNVGCIVHG